MYAGVIIDIAHSSVDRVFTYRVSDDMCVQKGMHVQVPFGHSNAKKEGFVVSLSDDAPGGIQYKAVQAVLEPYPVFTEEQLELSDWIKKSYNCTLAEALRLMIPAALRGGRIREKTVRTIRINEEIPSGEMMDSFRTANGKLKAVKQYELLKFLADSGAEFSMEQLNMHFPGCSQTVHALLQKGFVLENGHTLFRKPAQGLSVTDRHVAPTVEQDAAIHEIISAIDAGDNTTFLLHGVTGSGKTEVYMHAISHCLSLGRQAIMLVPEISLTPQTVGRFQARFGDRIAILHSALSTGERFDEWRRIRLGLATVAIGARSAIFAPFSNPGIFIIDEEHEASYQSENTPRYHAAEIAIHRAKSFGAPVVLGSATPSILSYFRASNGRYRLLSLPHRVMERPLPQVETVDMRTEFLSGNNSIFSGRLQTLLAECFSGGRQAMLFLNRRGYSTFISCRACGSVVQCANCDVAMTYHKREGVLKCHYCGYTAPLPSTCPICGKPFIKYFGIGTEQVEEQLHQLFPDVTSLRMDTDTMQHKDAYQQMLSSFSREEAQVLIGTQMIAKGHDFKNVTLVGIVAADATLNIPDYRSTERTYQLLEQVSGRAGRDEFPGRVVIQTYFPDHPAIRFAARHDYDAFYNYEILQRRRALFPPYSLFLRALFTGTDAEKVEADGNSFSMGLEKELHELLGENRQELLLILPSPAPIHKKQGIYRYQVLIKFFRTQRTGDCIRTVYQYAKAHRTETFAFLEVNPQEIF